MSSIFQDVAAIRKTQEASLAVQNAVLSQQTDMLVELKTLNATMLEVLALLNGDNVVTGVGVVLDPPGEKAMKIPVKMMKKSAIGNKSKAVPAAGPPAALILLDNEDDTGTLMGETKGGNLVDISAIATLTPAPSSADPTTVTVAPTTGMSFKVSAVGPVTPAPIPVTVTATWNDGSVGPFSIDIPVTVNAGPVGGVAVTFGTPTPH